MEEYWKSDNNLRILSGNMNGFPLFNKHHINKFLKQVLLKCNFDLCGLQENGVH